MWADDLTTTEIDGVTYYEIDDAADLVAFAELVNGGEYGANAVLTADIALTDKWDAPIGVITGEDNGAVGPGAFTGIFDGQGHKITGFDAESTGHSGLIGDANGATIKNFSISGILTVTGGHGSGVVAYSANSTIYNVHSALEIDVTDAGNICHVGGVVGSGRGGNTISNCTFSGSLNVAIGSHDCFGGIVGYMGSEHVLYCANYGKVEYEATNCYAGGIAGYINTTDASIKGCLNMGSVTYIALDGTPTYGGAIVGRLRTHDPAKMTDNCWLEGSATRASTNDSNADALTQAFCFTTDILPTGEVCHKLNGDQTTIGWYQTLDSDEQPTLDATHAQVYMVGHLHCNGDVYDGATFTNEYTEVIQDDHDYVDGFCSYCGLFNEEFLTPNADGYYEIATAKQLVWFQQFVNKGNFALNALLTADIDFEELTEQEGFTWTAIGDWGGVSGTSEACFKGHFNGQGHKILNFNVTSTHNYYGIFGVISSGSLIENFDIYGEMNLGHKTGGVVGYTRDATCTIRNIHSYLTINVTEAATSAERPGGILGSAVNGTTYVENCTYSGTLNVGDHTGNIGGIVGYINNNAAAIVFITNCLFDGEILNGTEADGQCGGIVGYNNAGTATIKNCLSIGTIESSQGNIGQFIGRLNGSNTTFANNYYTGDFVNGTKRGKSAKGTAPVKVTSEQLESGEICWELNEETFFDPIWKQTLVEENYPKPLGNGAIVYQTPDGYNCFDPNDSESFSTFRDGIIDNETEFAENTIAYQVLIDNYAAAIESWQDIDNLEDFLEAYQASAELKDSIKVSAENYAAYIQACEKANEDLEANHLEGATSNILKTYLLGAEDEPNETYPNGNYAYIMENRNLGDEEILAEIAFVNQMLEAAIMADGIRPGGEVTRLFTNPSFAEGFEGWTRENNGPTFATGGTTSVMPIVRGLGNGTFDVSQTLTDMPNGIYMMTANAMFRSGSDVTSLFYAGQLYMNGTGNYIKSPGEDVVLDNDTIPGENCGGYKLDERYVLDGVEGYVPNNMNGCSYFFNSGRYLNYCATEVTDGDLTVGVRSLGTGMDSDWLPFSNVHVTYLGTADEANDALAGVLDEFADRARVIVNSPVYDCDEAAKFPNIYEGLKDELSDAITDVAEATTGALKMDLINIFSDLFNQVHACRKAYIEMVKAADYLFEFLDVLLDAGIITEDEYLEWDAEITDAYNHFLDGDISTAQALEITQRLNVVDQLLPKVDGKYQLATADQLKLFSFIVNNGTTDIKAVLTEDIDMSELEDFQPIGTSSHPFEGEFDGQGHKITNFGQFVVEDEETGDGYYTLQFSNAKDSNGGGGEGFFGIINNATVKNFSIDGAFEVTGGNYKGVIGQTWKSTVSNVHSAMNIAINASGCHHCGGLIGSSEGGSSSTITNCSFSGTLTIAAGSTDNFAAILGYSGGDAVINCANYGKVIFSDAGCAAGGIVGYINNTTTYVQNCLNVGTVQCTVSNSPKYGGAIVGRIKNNWNAERVTNNYWLAGSAYAPSKKDDGTTPLAASATGETAGQLASGEVCYLLNGDQSEINWYQTLGEDEFPVLFDTHKVVYKNSDGYANEKTGPGTGTQEDPFVVRSAADLSNLINLLVSGSMNYVVMGNDVDMADVTDWTPLFNIPDQSNGYPRIDFDGMGHVIRNLTSNTTGNYDYCGLFGVLCGNVRNLGVENATVECAGGTGILAGYLGHSQYGQPCYVENVWVTGKVTANGYCGGMFGNVADESHLTNCYANVEVNGSGDLTGGIIGRVRNKVVMKNVYAAGTINRGGGIIGGGFQDATPAGSYTNIGVWNNTENNFGPARESDVLSGIIYYNGSNFADMQSQVVAWDPTVWSCDMEPGSYPILAAFDPDGIKGVTADNNKLSNEIFNLAGQRMSKMQKGINIVNGKKIFVK